MINSKSFPALLLSKGLLLSWNICVLNYFPPNVPACIFPHWISFYFSSVFLSSLETFSHLHYFSDLPSSVSKSIPLLSLTTSAAHLCLHRVTVLNSTWHFLKLPSVQVRASHTTGKEDPKSTCPTASVKNQLYFPQLSPYAKPNPWILLPFLHIALPHSFPWAATQPRSSHSSGSYILAHEPTWRLWQEASARLSLHYNAVPSFPR